MTAMTRMLWLSGTGSGQSGWNGGFNHVGAPEGGGSGGAPAWVPANAKIHIDLVGGSPQGRAWTEAAGEVAIDTLLGTDPGLTNWGDTGIYDPASLTPNGYVGAPMAMLSALRDAVIDAATLVIRTVTVSEVPEARLSFYVISESGEEYVNCYFADAVQRAVIESASGPLYQETDAVLNHDAAGDPNYVALTITNSRMDIAANGSAAVAGALTETDRPPDDLFVGALVNTTSSRSALQSITLYDPLPTTAGLSELSSIS